MAVLTPLRSGRLAQGQRFSSMLRGAMNTTAPRIEVGVRIATRERVRFMRMQRHLAVATIAGMACAIVTPAADTLLEMALVPVFVAVMLNSLARGVDARYGYWWGWLYPEPRLSTRLDRIVDRVVHRLVVAPADESPVRVRPLDPVGR